jgi:hypothetical protein
LGLSRFLCCAVHDTPFHKGLVNCALARFFFVQEFNVDPFILKHSLRGSKPDKCLFESIWYECKVRSAAAAAAFPSERALTGEEEVMEEVAR